LASSGRARIDRFLSSSEVSDMTRWIRIPGCAALLAAVIGAVLIAPAAMSQPQAQSPSLVAEIALEGPIGPAAAEYFAQAASRAEADGAEAIVLRLDTPGGLSESMRQIVSRILSAKVPVLGYVAPGGARAASAGTYILYACQIAAMAPATHLGAATPVSLGGVMPEPEPERKSDPTNAATPEASNEELAGSAETRKVRNDAIAYIRSLAQLRQRNADWAEAAVHSAATLTANEALKLGVIEFVAADVASLLGQANGRTVRVGEHDHTLQLGNVSMRAYEPNWRSRFLAIITNPTLAYLLLLAGIYGLVLEALHPGALLPGIVGAICLLVGLYALQLLPVNYAGLALMALGIALLVAEVLAPGLGALGIGGVISFVFGSILLFDTDVPGFSVNPGVIAGIAFCAISLLALLLWLVMRSRRAPRFSGDESLIEARGELIDAVSADGESWARVLGERWRVHCEEPLPAGARIRVLRRKGLQLWVTAE
jgi:membrane-bound serine protease (ClpP class)